jgi:simple sugar transport system ATP-binding protein
MSKKGPVLRVIELSKSFGGVQALKKISFDLDSQEIVGLVGDNGAGKSTLINLLMGVFPPDEGEIYFDGEAAYFSSPEESRKAGIEPVYQQTTLIDLMNLWRNFFLGREITYKVGPFSFLDKEAMEKASMNLMNKIGVHVRSGHEGVNFLSGGERQSVCLGRCMHFKAKLLLLDEPTAALSVKETEKVLDFIGKVKEQGLSVIIVDHNIYHIYPIVDKFVILDRGIKIAEFRKDDLSPEDIIQTIRTGHHEPNRGGKY